MASFASYSFRKMSSVVGLNCMLLGRIVGSCERNSYKAVCKTSERVQFGEYNYFLIE